MARGFESKDVEYQQAEAVRERKAPVRTLSPDERELQARRGTIELSIARAKADLELARSDAHRQMLSGALRALEEQLQHLRP